MRGPAGEPVVTHPGIAFILLFILQPMIMRLSRTMWLSWFVSYDAHWKNNPLQKPERLNKDQANNW